MAKRKTCMYTTPYGSREIYKNGKPFIQIKRADHGLRPPPPTAVDAVARKIARMLCKR